MRKFFKEPFVQFVVLGALLFVGHGLWAGKSGEANTIRVSAETAERLKTIYSGEQRRVPTDEDMKALVSAYVEEEALSREAEKLGLGEDDTIIRRRLAQKMRFMTENVGKPSAPKDAVLEGWYQDNLERFKQPSRISFQHIYLSPENNDNIETRAASLRQQALNGTDWKTLGDPFIMSRSLTRVTQKDIERAYGGAFAKAVIDLHKDEWSESIESAFGLHVVKISDREDGGQPSFEDARSEVEKDWLDETQRTENAKKINDIVAKYNIEIETQYQ